jgi:hypothetical protein
MELFDGVSVRRSIASITLAWLALSSLSQAQNPAKPGSDSFPILVGSATVADNGELAAQVKTMEGVSCGDTSRRVSQPTALKDFVGGRVKTIRVVHYARERNISKPVRLRALVSKVWQGSFLDQPACGIVWDEGTWWSIESTVEFEDGKRGLLITDGSHVALRDHDGRNWFFRLLPAAQQSQLPFPILNECNRLISSTDGAWSNNFSARPLQMEKCASNLVSAPLVLLLLQPYSLSRDNFVRLKAHHGESLASVKDDHVGEFCATCIGERAGTIRIDRVASVRPRDIGPVVGFRVAGSGRASDAARPVSVKEVEAHLGNRATHVFVHARPAPGIGPFEAGNATALVVGMNVDDSAWNASKSRKERETCHEKKILSEPVHFYSPFFLGLNPGSCLGHWERKVHPAISLKWQRREFERN